MRATARVLRIKIVGDGRAQWWPCCGGSPDIVPSPENEMGNYSDREFRGLSPSTPYLFVYLLLPNLWSRDDVGGADAYGEYSRWLYHPR
jgi:hypothetical protein